MTIESRDHSVWRYIPIETRMRLYGDARRLRTASMTYNQIMTEIRRMYSVDLPKSTLSGWIRGVNSPENVGHQFYSVPTPELAYVIGAKLGDASLNVKRRHYQYRIRLQAIDREFVQAFNDALAKILDCPSHKLWRGRSAKEIHVEYGSFRLYRFLQGSLSDFAPFIEKDNLCVAAFLRGFFDSEGSVSQDGAITASNSNLEVLLYIQKLLISRFGIETTGPRLTTKRGTTLPKSGRLFLRKVDCYSIYIRKRSNFTFNSKIGLTIERKRARLERFLRGGVRNGHS